MKKILYSPNAIEKLQEIKQDIRIRYGKQKANKVIKNILKTINGLRIYENKGPSVADLTGVVCDYRLIFTEHNYIFYKIDKSEILIVDIYNEREDFMWKLFRIKTRTQETEDYWNE